MRIRCALVAAAATALVAGCASDNSTTETATDAVTVEHVYGSTTIEGSPERIVAASSQWVDALLEFGVQPVAYLSAGSMGDERGLFPWQQDIAADAVALDSTAMMTGGDLPVEEIAALAPDLVLGAWTVTTQTGYDTLSAVAPTLPLLSDAAVDRWDEQVRTLGEILDREEDAEKIIADREAEIAAAALPGLEGRTGVLAMYMFGQEQFVVVADPNDGSAVLFDQLGMSLPPSLLEEPGVNQGRLMLSPERIDVLAGDLLIMLPQGGTEADLMALPGFAELPAVTGGGFALVDYATVAAFNTPSSLSIGYALDTIRPQLEAIAGA
ncbi:MAG: ABC transporter substrate-binding protein [Rhodococcus sp. (in: high G+C Gram-positive bacteria)]|uniref:ABC transporter substrate-binding protein n=1 Tax=Rhodococcus sp. TaxID=1831 RepID=UPI003BB660CD